MADSKEGKPSPAEEVYGQVGTEDGLVSYTRFEPEGGPTGEPVMVLPGTLSTWSNTRFARAVSTGAKTGSHTAFLVDHKRNEFELSPERIRELYPDAQPEVLALGIETLRRAHEAILILTVNKTRAHLVGHSFGGMVSVAIALLRPDLVRSLTLLNSAGLVPKREPKMHRGMFLKELFSHPSMIPSFLAYYFSNRKRADKEGEVIAGSSIVPLLVALGRAGVPITIVYGKEDKLFPPNQVQEELRKAGDNPPFVVQELDRVNHNGPVINPPLYGKLVSGILKRVESREE